MRTPRNIDGMELVKALSFFGYEITRQTGSHMRLTTSLKDEHHITIPNHRPLKIGTLNAILSDVAEHLKISKGEILEKL
ncbi:MAG: type II toxin-antitoxin system HicA family toxin [Spirochaetota bacterium]